MKKKKSITINVIYNFIYQGLTVLLPLITTPYLSRVIGSEGIGINGYTFSIVTYFVLFGSLGTAMYGQREIAKRENDKEEYSKTFFEIFFLRLGAMVISMLIFYLFFCHNNGFTLYYQIFLLYMIAYALNISWFFQGMEEFDKIVLRNIIVKLLSVIFIFIFVKKPSDLWIYILIFSLSELLGSLSLYFYLPKYLNKKTYKKANLKKHIIPTIELFLPQIAIQIYTVLDKTMVGYILKDMNEVGYYEQAQNIAKAALVIMASVQTVMNSRVAFAHQHHDNEEVKKCLDKSFAFVWLLGIPLMFGLMAVSNNLISWYYGAGFEPVKTILIISCPLIIIIGLSGITGIVYLIQTGKQKVFTKSVILGAVINVILNFILINFIGTIGAAISSIIAELSILIYHLIEIKKVYKITNILQYSVKPLLSGIIMFGIVLLVSTRLSSSIVNTLILVIIGIITYTIPLLLLKYPMLIDTLNTLKQFITKRKTK